MSETYKFVFMCIIFCQAIVYFVQYQLHIGNDYQKLQKFNFEKYVDVVNEQVKVTTQSLLILPSILI